MGAGGTGLRGREAALVRLSRLSSITRHLPPPRSSPVLSFLQAGQTSGEGFPPQVGRGPGGLCDVDTGVPPGCRAAGASGLWSPTLLTCKRELSTGVAPRPGFCPPSKELEGTECLPRRSGRKGAPRPLSGLPLPSTPLGGLQALCPPDASPLSSRTPGVAIPTPSLSLRICTSGAVAPALPPSLAGTERSCLNICG